MAENEEITYPYEFDEERRKKAKLYSKQKFFTGIIQTFGLYLPFLAITYFSGFTSSLESWIRELASGTFLSHHWIITAIFILIYSILLYVISLPISYYSGFLLEHKYDLSNDTIWDWSKDQIKSLLISLIFMVPITLALFFLGYSFPDLWWLYAGILFFVISGILSNISHLIILPLFYDMEELEDEELKERLTDMSEKHGVAKLKKVVVVKASEKTEKANAGFAGMGKTKRLLLFDTLLDKFHPKEIEGVVAHELGHYVNKDVIRYVLINAGVIFPIFYLTGRMFTAYGSFGNIYYLPLFLLILYGLYSLIDPLTNAYSRYREKKADRFAIETTGEPQAMISGFKRLSDIDLAELDPHKLIEIFFYDHPAPKKRIDRAKNFSKVKENKNKKDK
ncbi:MAG: M48 family metallopeptidase [Candidatus Thermoplasmatota archaeon]